MSFTPIEDTPKSNQELDSFMLDVQRLMYAHQSLKADHAQLKIRIKAQDQTMQTAHKRLVNLLKRLPLSLAQPIALAMASSETAHEPPMMADPATNTATP
jgi:hypothetical protein